MDSTYALVTGVLIFCVYKLYKGYDPALDAIPTIGWSTPGLSYLSAIRFIFQGKAILDEGYDKYKDSLFKIPMIDHWSVVVNSPKLIDELRKAPDDHLDFNEAVVRSIEAFFTLGPSVVKNDYHTGVIRSTLTRNLVKLFPVIRDEISSAFSEIIPTGVNDEWVKVPAIDSMLKIVCRTSNRIFVGPEKCRDPDWIALNSQFTIDVITSGLIINRFPEFLKPIAGRIFSKLPSSLRRAEGHIRPLVEERRRMMEELGDSWTDKPNDMLMWLMETAVGEEKTLHCLAARLLTVNFAAMHTSSMSFTQALYHLAGNPEYMQPLREEVESIVATHGWSKESLNKMRKIDSFMRESQRFNGLGLLVMSRYVRRPFTFSNGITVPAGTVLDCPVSAIHHDGQYFPDADVFSPFRFSDMREDEGESLKHQMVSTALSDSSPFLSFGHGRHACPGRFFAANELKAMLAHIVTEYDVKFEDGAPHPKNTTIGSTVVPANANVLFRKRQRA